MNVYDLSLDSSPSASPAWGEPAFRAKQVYRSSGGGRRPTSEMTDVAPRLRERLARGAAARGRAARRAHGRPRRDAQGAAPARRRPRDRDRADGLPGPRDRVRLVAVGVRDGLRVLRDRPDGADEQPHRGRDRGAGRVGPARGGPPAAVDAAAAHERRVHGDGRADANERQCSRRGRAAHRPARACGSARGTSRSRRSASCRGSGGWPRTTARCGLAVSFHAADDELRNELVPANRLWPLDRARGGDRRLARAHRTIGPRSSGR